MKAQWSITEMFYGVVCAQAIENVELNPTGSAGLAAQRSPVRGLRQTNAIISNHSSRFLN